MMFPLFAQEAAKAFALNPAGMTMMVVSITSVLILTFFCLYRVMTLPPVEIDDMHAPQNIDTGDTKDVY